MPVHACVDGGTMRALLMAEQFALRCRRDQYSDPKGNEASS